MTRLAAVTLGRAFLFFPLIACSLVAADLRLSTTEVGRVNGAVVTAGEFVDALRRKRFQTQGQEEARRTAWEACVRFKLLQLFACELGRLDEASDAALRKVWRGENQRRAAADQRTVFGPRQLNWEQFRATWSDGIEREYGRRRLREATTNNPARDEYSAFAAALEQARKVARTTADTGAIARLEANTVFVDGSVAP